MAERGGDRSDDSDNPFSFKAFINVKEKKPIEKDIFSDDEDEEDIFETAPAPTSTASASTRKLSSESLDFDLDATPSDDKPKDNPFSFKKFLSSSSSASTTTKPTVTLVSSFEPPDVASDIPSFRNNYFEDVHTSRIPEKPTDSSTDGTITKTKSKTKTVSTEKKKQKGASSSSRSKFDDSPRNATSFKDKSLVQLPLFDNDDDDDDDDDDHFESGGDNRLNGRISPGVLQLPDFLSDGPLLGGKPTMPIHEGDRKDMDEDLLSQVHTLQEENRRLQDDLASMKQNYDEKSQRITQLKKDLERQKKKEAEETAVMEKAVLQVEENLVTTTQRAVQAETAALKLKQEVKGLQNQVRCLTAENEAFRSGDEGLAAIRERTKYTSEQLDIGAKSAEKNLKELLQGVEQMKLLSQVLASWEKVTEVKPEADESKS